MTINKIKKVIFSIGLATCLVSCSEKAPVDYALLTGKIDNLDKNEITLLKEDNSFSKKITTDTNGYFSDTIKNPSGLYALNVGKRKKVDIYLEEGNDINLTADAKKLVNSIDVSGEGAEVTNYFFFKNKKVSEFRIKGKELYKLTEPDFKKKFNEIKTYLTSVIDTLQGVSATYKNLEKRNLNYEYLNELSRYAGGYHRHWAKNKAYKTSETFLEELDEVDLNNELDYQFSSAYREIVNRHYNEKIKYLINEGVMEYGLVKVSVYSEVENQYIKNKLIFNKAEFEIYNTTKLDEYYKIFMNASTDEENNAKITKIYNILAKVGKGNPSPKFVDYENNAGGTLSLDDFKGKYLYIDIWATWCGPCIREIPDLRRVEKMYHGKNISFLSISIDEPKDHDKWKNMIKNNKLGGTHVLADKAFNSQFILDYNIRSIPRFILIDPNGVIVTQHAPAPSNPELIDLFNELNL
ncbi:TlpA family protein disulfide reductase [Polaribacter sargassicola]|uniref:TlpA family protein disulfide reductase n=1 Tax=Polaribacter sargassicola TaxID=2836891 RepID=UPI001F19F9F9|nr:TlpA disulfide reductase family protein [Polaribacter sp. DS7-9]MCG1037306.1 TlpA family protein disulfide reductase [Polaribacter sp. DS7-9]